MVAPCWARTGAPELNRPCLTQALVMLFLWLTQVFWTHENMAIASILHISHALLLAFSYHLYYLLTVVFYIPAKKQAGLPFDALDAEGCLLVWYLDPVRKKDGTFHVCLACC